MEYVILIFGGQRKKDISYRSSTVINMNIKQSEVSNASFTNDHSNFLLAFINDQQPKKQSKSNSSFVH